MSDDVLNVQVGAILQLQATTPEQAPRHNVRVIGYLPGASLVVTTPTVKGNLQIVREGQRFNVRMLRGNSVMGFVAQVLQTYLKPYPHLHLEYPRDVESIMVRNAQRVAASIFATARDASEPDSPEYLHEISLMDLSASGAKLGSAESIGEVGDTLHLSFSVDVAGQQETLSLLADIRNRFQRDGIAGNDGSNVYGVQFRSLNRFQQLLLHGWVLERLVAENRRRPS